ncbi:unnamed protein product [Polarella glacialis]|uniref:Nudix hydrolase domain-containing protein n=1 Tax=Polarella glacialis TaxID=89957 RepID=A0A813HQL5_POLGL|nr:unnamed protein product [Polarella glacialis]
MPGHLATVGGMRDKSDLDSRHTTLREVGEETGLLQGIVIQPAKFAEGAKCDWYVMLVQQPLFKQHAESRFECGDIRQALPWLPATATVADCFGHAWVPVGDLQQIDEQQQPLMGGLLNRVWQAVKHLQYLEGLPSNPKTATTRTTRTTTTRRTPTTKQQQTTTTTTTTTTTSNKKQQKQQKS